MRWIVVSACAFLLLVTPTITMAETRAELTNALRDEFEWTSFPVAMAMWHAIVCGDVSMAAGMDVKFNVRGIRAGMDQSSIARNLAAETDRCCSVYRRPDPARCDRMELDKSVTRANNRFDRLEAMTRRRDSIQ